MAPTFVAALLGGVLILSISLYFVIYTNLIEWPIVFLFLCGCVLSFFGLHILMTRGKRPIVINKEGITIFQVDRFIHIPADKITLVQIFTSPVRPRIEITLVDGETFFLDYRYYCKPSFFIKCCKEAGLPCT